MQRSRCTPRVGGLALVLLLLAACAAGSAHAASLGLRGGSLKIARPNPDIYANYTFQSSRDTFDLCKEQSGLRREVPLEELLPQFGLPADLTQRKTITLAQFLEMCAAAAPAATLVVAPMLHGDTDLHASLSEGLPKLVHFTVRNKDALVPHQVVSIASWAVKNPGYSVMLWDDADISAFMAAYYPHLLPTFNGLGSQVERTDMWRYLVLCTFGGVYADSDVVCAKPVDEWHQAGAGLLVGIENVFTTMEAAKKRTYTRMMQMVQWTMAACRGHPVVCRMGDYVARHVAEESSGQFVDADRDHSILERTGPGIWSSSVHDFLLEAGAAIEGTVAGALVGDVRVLPQTVFGCASAAWNPQDSIPYVYHMFKGSWRQERPNILRVLLGTLLPGLFPLPEQKKAAPAQQQPVAPGSGQKAAQDSRKLRAAGVNGPAVAIVGIVPLAGAVALVGAVCYGVALHVGRRTRGGVGGSSAGSAGPAGRTRGLLSGSASHASLAALSSKSSGALDEPPLSSRSGSPLLRGEGEVACATGTAAQPPQTGFHHKRSWGSFSNLRSLQHL